jgi:hypothetical protein
LISNAVIAQRCALSQIVHLFSTSGSRNASRHAFAFFGASCQTLIAFIQYVRSSLIVVTGASKIVVTIANYKGYTSFTELLKALISLPPDK